MAVWYTKVGNSINMQQVSIFNVSQFSMHTFTFNVSQFSMHTKRGLIR